MPCFSPLEGARRVGSGEKPIVYKSGGRPDPLDKGWEALDLPCGRCIGCRLEHSRIWGARCAHEASLYDDNCFLTLTYRNESEATDGQRSQGLFMPSDGSLNKKHHQDFLKRLRYYLGGRRISYYHCGEYGDETGRPHYHTLLFNFDFPDKQLFKYEYGYQLFTSELLDEIWKFGYCWIGSVTFESAAYVARYCLKKVTGSEAHFHYLRYNEQGAPYWLEPEYATMSRNPAIGRGFYEEFRTDMFPLDRLPIPGRGEFGKPPRYYEKLFAELYPDEMAKVKERREVYWTERPEEGSPQRLADKEKVTRAKLAMLKRESQ